MTRRPVRDGISLAAIAAMLATPVPALSQEQPGGPSYPTNTNRPTPRPPSPPRAPTGGILMDRPAATPAPQETRAAIELPTPDVQLANGWITQEQFNELQAQGRNAEGHLIRMTTRNLRQAQSQALRDMDRFIEDMAALGPGERWGDTPEQRTQLARLRETLVQEGYQVSDNMLDDPARTAESFVRIMEGGISAERNAGSVIRPIMQDYIRAIDGVVTTNVDMLRQGGRVPPDVMREYTRAQADIHTRTVARIDRLMWEHDRQIDDASRIITENRQRLVTAITNGLTRGREQYGNDMRQWPGANTPRPQAPAGFSYTGVLTGNLPPRATPTPPPPNPRNLPALGDRPGVPRPVPVPLPPEPVPTPVPVPPPSPSPVPPPNPRGQVRPGVVPPADPFEGLRVPQPAPRPRPRPTPPPPPPPPPPPRQQQQRVPDPVVLQQTQTDPEFGGQRRLPGQGTPSPSLLDEMLSRVPRNRDGSINWSLVPLSIRAQLILWEHSRRNLNGGSGSGGGSGGGGYSSEDAALRREYLRQLDEAIRLNAAAERRWQQDTRWQNMVNDRFGPGANAFGTNNGPLQVLQLEPIYRNYNPLNAIPPAMSLSSAGWSLSSAGTDWRDPALQSLYETMGMFDYRRRSNPLASGYDVDRARAAQFAYNAGDFDVQFNRDGRLSLESGGRLMASLFTLEEYYLRQITANGQGGLNQLLAQPFNVVLTWGAGAFDLDLHMTGPLGEGVNERFHIYYAAAGNLDAQPFARLIRDCICASGSEVILTSALNRGGVYRVSVFNFGDQSASSTNLANASNARIEIVRGGTTQALGNGTTIIGGRSILTVDVPVGGAGNTWVAAELDPRNGRITVPARIRQSPGSGGVE